MGRYTFVPPGGGVSYDWARDHTFVKVASAMYDSHDAHGFVFNTIEDYPWRYRETAEAGHHFRPLAPDLRMFRNQSEDTLDIVRPFSSNNFLNAINVQLPGGGELIPHGAMSIVEKRGRGFVHVTGSDPIVSDDSGQDCILGGFAGPCVA